MTKTPLLKYERQKAAKILLQRKAARQNLIAFTRMTFPEYKPAEHHYKIAEKLEAVEAGKIRRLMIFMPPRHGKTELASIRFPAWVLGRNPERHVISTAYNQDRAAKYGRQVRNLIDHPKYQKVFKTKLAPDSKSATSFHTKNGGSYEAAGSGTGITGGGAHFFLIDDPIKNREDACSESMQKKIYDWYTAVAYTRLENDIREEKNKNWLWENTENQIKQNTLFNGAIVLIQTRWHEKDLAGRLLNAMQKGADQWQILNLPAIKNKKALWPAKYPLATLEKTQTVIGNRDFQALYQQNPTPEKGSFFQREWFKSFQKKPENIKIYGASDYAVTNKGGDATIHIVCGVDENHNLYILDRWKGKTEPNYWIEALLDLAEKHKPLLWAEENGQIIKSIGAFLNKRMAERKIWFLRQQFNSTKDKPTRARAIQARAAMGKIFLPEQTQWADEIREECVAFPNGQYDDQVDTLSLIGRMLDKMSEPENNKKNKKIRFPIHGNGKNMQSEYTIQQWIDKNTQKRNQNIYAE